MIIYVCVYRIPVSVFMTKFRKKLRLYKPEDASICDMVERDLCMF